MAGPSQDNERASERAGMFGHLSALAAAKMGYLHARLRLAGIEGREAAIHVAIIVGLAVAGLVALIFGYFFLVVGLAFVVALAFGGGNAWIWVLIAAAVLHFLGAAVLVLYAKAKLAAPVFPLTLEEFRKDQAWFKTAKKGNS